MELLLVEDPFEQSESFAKLGKEVKKLGLNIITYTGYTYEQIVESIDKKAWKDLLYVTDVLIDGSFEINKRSLELKFRGSSNQRIIDVKKSLENNNVVLAKL